MYPQLTGWRQQSEKRQEPPLAPPAELRGASPRAAAQSIPCLPPLQAIKPEEAPARPLHAREFAELKPAHDRSTGRNGTEPAGRAGIREPTAAELNGRERSRGGAGRNEA
jgi:hypothetical protein